MAAPGLQTVVCDVSDAPVTLGSIDALARITLAAKRLGYSWQVQGASDELLELLELVGLRDVLLD